MSSSIIKRIYIKELLFFNSLELEFDSGLIVFTGASGAGKSILISSLLSTFGLDTPKASMCEVTLEKFRSLELDSYDIDDEFSIKSIKRDKLRYYIDGQKISKKSLQLLFKPPFITHLSVRDRGGFSSDNLISFIDTIIIKNNRVFKKELREYKKRFKIYQDKLTQLQELRDNQSKIKDLIEFIGYEISKIDTINPKVGEEEELLRLKQQLSKIDKIKEATDNSQGIFEFETQLIEAYSLVDKDSSFINDTFNQIRADFDDIDNLSQELEDIDIEELLNRIEQISSLIERYGSIPEALEYREKKLQELDSYKNISYDMKALEEFVELEYQELINLAYRLDSRRREVSIDIEEYLYEYLKELKLSRVNFIFTQSSLSNLGNTKVDLSINDSTTATLSGGEFNRLRLALMVVVMQRGANQQAGVIILDEIDANVSGDESIAIANLISKLSEKYQIFAISHQPHLTAKANQHILVSKSSSGGEVEILDREARIQEIARIIAGERANSEAMEFARNLIVAI
ncbi:DNA repair protein RecN [hydrothermal vent metagenome]|uniref:DNA repair protein RecN n=1 Tax=hydrothermal vent metagenome TaxID=652676 RepID=A0A1W1EK97_9ZZZZ